MAITWGLSSCLGSDDNDNTTTFRNLTQSEKTKSLIEAQGTYSGRLYYYDNQNQTDSIDLRWTLTGNDSVLTISEFPIKAFSNSVIADTATINILKNYGTKELIFTLHPYYNTRFDGGYYSYSLLPNMGSEVITPSDEDTQKGIVTIKFANYFLDYTINGQPIYTYPFAEYFNSQMQGYILIDELVVNNRSFSVGKAYYFYGEKN
jgi:hypothetical protein